MVSKQKVIEINEPPTIVTPKIDFKGSVYHFALAKHNQYAENKNRPEYKWASTKEIFFKWIASQWTINGRDFTAEEITSSLSIGIEKGLINSNEKKEIPK
tara:strand:- start:219 stop:518 length:300 start_codon:yes stop_codon:yes gene_type:complete